LTKSVIISGPPAVGKTTVALALAKKFDLKYISGGDVLKEIAKDHGFSSGGDDWWDTEDGMKFLAQRAEHSEFDKQVDEKLQDLFYQGGMVITSYTLPWLVKDGIKIWLEGSHENSTLRMKNRDNIGKDEAFVITKKRYLKNKVIYKKLYNFDFGDDTSVFDTIINTDNLNAEQVIEIVKSTVKELL
jgi:cytidylate kinase